MVVTKYLERRPQPVENGAQKKFRKKVAMGLEAFLDLAILLPIALSDRLEVAKGVSCRKTMPNFFGLSWKSVTGSVDSFRTNSKIFDPPDELIATRTVFTKSRRAF